MKKITIITILLTLTFYGYSQRDTSRTGVLHDARDSTVYKTVKIGNNWWMAENLNYETPNSKYINDDYYYCILYGRLYTAQEAISACPDGWHLSTDAEWSELEIEVGGRNNAGKVLKATKGWEDNGNGTNSYGFNALPGGKYDRPTKSYYYEGSSGYWWYYRSGNLNDGLDMGYRSLGNSSSSIIRDNEAAEAYSIRCVKD